MGKKEVFTGVVVGLAVVVAWDQFDMAERLGIEDTTSILQGPIDEVPPTPDETGGPEDPGEPKPTDKPPRGDNPKTISIANVLEDAKPLPNPAGAQAAFRRAHKEGGVDWSRSKVIKLPPEVLTPQGLGGTGTAVGHVMDGNKAVDRNILLVSSYRGETTRLAIIDTDKKEYNSVELVKNGGKKLSSHGSGAAMAGDYIYTSSRGELFAFKADGFKRRGKGYVLPAMARWAVRGAGGFSSIHVDTSRTPNQLVGINYTKGGATYVQRFDLAKNGLLATRGGSGGLRLVNSYGFPTKTLRSKGTIRMPGTHYQGVGSFTKGGQQFTFGVQSGHKMVIMKNGRHAGSLEMANEPRTVSESAYRDPAQGEIWHINEHGHELLYSVPENEVVKQAR